MTIIKLLEEKLNTWLSKDLLIKLTLVFVIVFLGMKTWSLWSFLLTKIIDVLSPFLTGFIIAYILSEPINWLENHHVKRSVSIPCIYAIVALFVIWLLSSLVPMVIMRTGDLLNSLTGGLSWLYNLIQANSSEGVPEWFVSLLDSLRSSVNNMKSLLPAISSTIPTILASAVDLTVRTVFSVVVSIFMCFGWHSIKYHIKKTVGNISALLSSCLTVMDYEVGSYIHSLLILMIIRFFEYSLVYLVVGHHDWMILALMTSISLLIPYLGPTVVNCIGILTALTLPVSHILLLIGFIVVLSFVDEYVIAPLVHSHNTGVTPLWSLFSIFAGGTLFGAVGIIAAIPAYLSIRSIYRILIQKGSDTK